MLTQPERQVTRHSRDPPRKRSWTLTIPVPTTWRWPASWVSKDRRSTKDSKAHAHAVSKTDTQSPGSLLKPTAAHTSSESLSTYAQEKTPKNKSYEAEQRPWVFFHFI